MATLLNSINIRNHDWHLLWGSSIKRRETI